jgi:hypothetical protein
VATSWQETQEVGARRKSQPSPADYDLEQGMLCGKLRLGPLLIMVGAWTIACRAKCCLHSMEFLAVLRNSSDEPNKVNTKKCHVLKVYYTKIKQKKNRMLL